jgi:protein involved in polysaccharide export with SLBB domain
MWLITTIKSDMRFLLAALCLTLVTSVGPAQGQSPVSCHEVVVFGAVKTPRRLEIAARIRLAELLTSVGGPSDRAGKVVRVLHSCRCSPCAEGELKASVINEYNLSAALQGTEDANPFVTPGEIIIVPEAELVWVVGNVVSQKSLVYREGVRLTQAIAMVGGIAKHSDLIRIQIYRDPARARPNLPIFTFKTVLDNRSEDPVLQPSDIIEISDETGKFRSPLWPPLWNPPLMHPPGDPQLIQRRSPNC